MKYQHIKRIWKNPFYVNFKKHYCSICGAELEKTKISKIVNWKSKEAETFDFPSGDSFMIGNVKFIWNEFKCPICRKSFSVDEMKQIEKEKVKGQGKAKE